MKTSFLLLCILVLFQGCSRSPRTVQDDGTGERCPNCLFLLDGAAQQAFDDTPVPDPSGIPQINIFDQPVQERARFVADFDGDGLEDIALAAEPECFGTGGGIFFLYLQTTNGLFRNVGDFGAFADDGGVIVEHLKDADGPDGRIWTYSKHWGNSLIVSWHDIRDGKMAEEGRVELYTWGDIDGRITNLIFDNPSPASVRLEWGISTNGTVVWPTLPGLVPKKNAADDTP